MAQTAALLPFMDRDAVMALYQSGTLSGTTGRELLSAWRDAAVVVPKPWVPSAQPMRPLPLALAELERQSRGSPLWQTFYEPYGSTFAMVRAADLITYQFRVNWNRVQELAARVPGPDDSDALYRFCFPEPNLALPLRQGNAVIFTARDLGHVVAKTQPEVRRVDDATVDLVVQVSSRPNFLYAAALDNRLVLLNGNHRVPALIMAGHEYVPCAIIPSEKASPKIPGLTPPTTFPLETLLAPRPPLVADFLDRSVATLFETLESIGGLQLTMQTLQLPFPHPLAPGSELARR